MMGEKLFSIAGTLSMMTMALVLAVVLVSLIVGCLGCVWVSFAFADYGQELMQINPMPY